MNPNRETAKKCWNCWMAPIVMKIASELLLCVRACKGNQTGEVEKINTLDSMTHSIHVILKNKDIQKRKQSVPISSRTESNWIDLRGRRLLKVSSKNWSIQRNWNATKKNIYIEPLDDYLWFLLAMKKHLHLIETPYFVPKRIQNLDRVSSFPPRWHLQFIGCEMRVGWRKMMLSMGTVLFTWLFEGRFATTAKFHDFLFMLIDLCQLIGFGIPLNQKLIHDPHLLIWCRFSHCDIIIHYELIKSSQSIIHWKSILLESKRLQSPFYCMRIK